MQRETVGLAKPPGINQHVDRVVRKPEAPPPLPTLAEAGIDKNLADRRVKIPVFYKIFGCRISYKILAPSH